MRLLQIGWLLLLGVTMLANAQAQAPEPRPSFEVASVKRQAARLGPPGPPPSARGPRFYRANATVASLVQFGYDVTAAQLVGGPEWIRGDLFEINATVGTPAAPDQERLMVQSLLEERFRLVVREEQWEMRHAVLTVAREDRRLGVDLKTCDDARNTPPGEPIPVPPGAVPLRVGTGGVNCVAMSALARVLSAFLGTPVIDRTGLTGTWSYSLMFAQLQPLPADPGRELGDQATAPSLPAAIQEQLGLRLDYANGPVDVLVIESVEQPTDN